MNITKLDVENYGTKLVIYRIFNKIDNKSYIGKSKNGLERVLEHLQSHKRPNEEHRSRHLYRAMKKHGPENYGWEILYIAENEAELNSKEIEYISKFGTIDRKFGYNRTKGGDGGSTWQHLSEEETTIVKEKLSISGKKAYLNNPERKTLMSENLKKMRADPEKSKKNAEMSRARLLLLTKTDPRFKSKTAIKVKCLENGIIYNSLKEAAAALGIKAYSSITNAINRKDKCKGYSFEYIKKDTN